MEDKVEKSLNSRPYFGIIHMSVMGETQVSTRIETDRKFGLTAEMIPVGGFHRPCIVL